MKLQFNETVVCRACGAIEAVADEDTGYALLERHQDHAPMVAVEDGLVIGLHNPLMDALRELDQPSVKQLATHAEISESSARKWLKPLVVMGLAIESGGRPRTYRPNG